MWENSEEYSVEVLDKIQCDYITRKEAANLEIITKIKDPEILEGGRLDQEENWWNERRIK